MNTKNYFLLVRFKKIKEAIPPIKTPKVCTAHAIIPMAKAILGWIEKATKIVWITIGKIPIPPGVSTTDKEPKNRQTKAEEKGKFEVSGSAL